MNSVRFINLENCFFMLVIKLNIAVNTVDFLFYASTQFLGFNRESTVHVQLYAVGKLQILNAFPIGISIFKNQVFVGIF